MLFVARRLCNKVDVIFKQFNKHSHIGFILYMILLKVISISLAYRHTLYYFYLVTHLFEQMTGIISFFIFEQ
jgi:hypothetical protein